MRIAALRGGLVLATCAIALTARGQPAATPEHASTATPAAASGPAKPPAGQGAAAPKADDTVRLDVVEVTSHAEDDGFDRTGMGSYEHQLRDSPFSNDLITAEALEDDPAALELATELATIASTSPAIDLATGDSRVSLRGFPAPLMVNGFVRMGGIDILNTARTIIIQGALVPVLGRAAPGGIQDFWTNRPRTAKSSRYDYSISSLDRQTASFEVTGPMVAKRAWHRVAGDWNRKEGPEAFAMSETRSLYSALTWKHSSKASTLFSLDYLQVRATAAPGIPEYRRATGDKIVGPYLPLAGFNALGPEAGIRRRSAVASVLIDAQPHPKLAVRGGVETWWRRIEQDRFTTSLLNLTTRKFEGTREPLHSEQPQTAWKAHAELIGRFSAWRAEHKLMFAASHTEMDYYREERALPTAVRNALPASARIFDPLAPDYSRPPYSPELYSRVLTDRKERSSYTALEISERIGLAKGRWVFTTGVRQDFVGLEVNDRRTGAAMPHVADRVGQMTYHFGANYQAKPSRLLLFATTSTAFEPSTRVDIRTGRIQGNETTRGYEGGLKARAPSGLAELTVSAFTLFNEDISRRNPLYGDPIADANHTQPQLVAAGEETFTGGKFEGRWKPDAKVPLTFTARFSYVRAITTASPDLPEEVGRELTRMPPYTATASASYSLPQGKLKGLSLSGSWNYFSRFVANYEDRQRYELRYPGYALVTLSAGYSKRLGKRTHGVSASIRNLFDTDLVQKQARLGAGRELYASYRVTF